jgi:hypothetical protein
VRYCDVNWGSHGCVLPLFHDGAHECDCCECENHPDPLERLGYVCVAKPPYFGPDTRFWGSVWHPNSDD